MTIFFTSDSHFGHNNIIKYCNRPFQTVEEMNSQIIRQWNEKVKGGDLIYHLGDFGFGSKATLKTIFDHLNGQIILIRGNHDDKKSIDYIGFQTVKDMDMIEIGGKHIHLCHYPLESWNGQFHGSYHFHGHSHGQSLTVKNRFDVGMDCFGYAPVTFEEIVR